MNILIVNFNLEGLTEAGYYRECDEVAPAFAEVPGLISKVWLADPATNTYGGVYTFVDRAALEAFTSSELFAAVGATPGLVNISVRAFDVLDAPTRVTRGGVTAAA
jgi:hypothetical protein